MNIVLYMYIIHIYIYIHTRLYTYTLYYTIRFSQYVYPKFLNLGGTAGDQTRLVDLELVNASVETLLTAEDEEPNG